MRAIEIINETETLDEITRPSSIDDAKAILRKAGYKELGAGMTGKVFNKPGANHVLKLFDSEDDAYWKFVSLAKASNNIHFPKFKGKLIKINDSYYAVQMEKLTRIPDYSASYFPSCSYPDFSSISVSGLLQNYILLLKKSRSSAPAELPRYVNLSSAIDQLEEDQPGIKDACKLIASIVDDSMVVDLHDENIMLRGNTLVITDPVTFN